MNKLTYQENIGLLANCPKIVKHYNTKSALVRDYLKFKENWTEIARKDPYNNKIDENSGDGFKIIGLTTIVNGDNTKTQLTWVKSVEIEFDEQ